MNRDADRTNCTILSGCGYLLLLGGTFKNYGYSNKK